MLCALARWIPTLTLLVFPWAARGSQPAFDLDTLGRQARPGVLLVIACDARGLEAAYGTAFVVAKDGRLVTNRHVVQGSSSAFVRTHGSRRFRVLGVLAEDAEHDLVLLQTDARDLPALPLGASRTARPGSPVGIVGNPRREPGVALAGKILHVNELLGQPGWMQIEAPIQPGSSGSPVLNAQGEVIGVIEAVVNRQRPLALAMPVEIARRLLARAAREPAPLSSLRGRSEEYVFFDLDFAAAVSAKLEKDLDEAGKRIRAVLKRNPKSTAAHLLSGQIAEDHAAFDDARTAYEEAIRLKPDFAEAWHRLGIVCLQTQKHEEALAALQRATTLRPDHAGGWSRLSEAYQHLAQPGRAIDALRRVTELTPEDEQAWVALADAYERVGETDRAVSALAVAVRIKADSPALWRRLGDGYLRQRQHRLAADAFERTLQLNPDDVEAWDRLGRVCAELGEHRKLERAIEKLRSLAPGRAAELEKLMHPPAE
jgi:cytochrome c-type biogenesis protein CcmH/NrfG